MRSLLKLAGLSAVLSLTASGQTQYRMLGRAGAAIMPIAPTAAAHPRVSITTGAPQRSHHRPFAPGFFLGGPWDYFDSGSEQTPQVIVLQQPAASTPQIVEQAPPSPIMPLLIELQDGRYVRYRSGPQGVDADANTRSVRGSQIKTDPSTEPDLNATAAALLPVELLFRDGHREQVDSYAIFAGAIQINVPYSTRGTSAYWTSGSWARSIPLADLDLPATLQLNRERGIKFVLPAGPNEVVTRP